MGLGTYEPEISKAVDWSQKHPRSNSKPGTSSGGVPEQVLQKEVKAGNLLHSRPKTANSKGAEQSTGALS